jgi:gas vesicle protein
MSDNTGRFLEGILVGGVFGFVFGILTAPKSGAELRKQITDGSEDMYKQASESIAELKDKTNHAISDLQAKSEDVMKQASDTMQTKKQQLSGKLQDLTGQAKALAEDVESMSSN